MKKQCVIVGLGKYGMSVTRQLADAGFDVLAIDNDLSSVEKADVYATKAICMDVTSSDAWEELQLNDFDIGIVCFGENVTASVFSVMALQTAGVKYIIAKAGDTFHKRVLEKLKVDEVVFPEELVANFTAKKIIDMNK
jgi:trk system potassium uptake protein TrkA